MISSYLVELDTLLLQIGRVVDILGEGLNPDLLTSVRNFLGLISYSFIFELESIDFFFGLDLWRFLVFSQMHSLESHQCLERSLPFLRLKLWYFNSCQKFDFKDCLYVILSFLFSLARFIIPNFQCDEDHLKLLNRQIYLLLKIYLGFLLLSWIQLHLSN